jgi:hypothetical protein
MCPDTGVLHISTRGLTRIAMMGWWDDDMYYEVGPEMTIEQDK